MPPPPHSFAQIALTDAEESREAVVFRTKKLFFAAWRDFDISEVTSHIPGFILTPTGGVDGHGIMYQ